MKKIVIILGLLGFLVLVTLVGRNLLAATNINKAIFDCPTVMVSSGSSVVAPGNPCWGSQTEAEHGNDLQVRVYYHNTGKEIARNVRIKLFPKESSVNRSQQFSASIFADNGDVVIGSAVVNVKQPTKFIFSGGAIWYTNDARGQSSLLDSQTIQQLFSANGLKIGDVLPGPEHRGSLVLTYKLSSPSDPINSFDNPGNFSVGTSPVKNVSTNSAQLNGFVAPRGNILKTSFEYGETVSLGRSIIANQNQTSASEISRTITLLEKNKTYYYRFCAESGVVKRCGVTSSFSTKNIVAVSSPVVEKPVLPDPIKEGIAPNIPEVIEPQVDNTVSIPLDENNVSFVYIGIDNGVHTFEPNEYVTYTVRFGNTDKNLHQVGIYIDLPRELEFVSSNEGSYITSEHAVVLDEKSLAANLAGSFFIHMKTPMVEGEHVPVLATAALTYRNPDSGARETATSYDVDHVYGVKISEIEEVDNTSLAALVGGVDVSINGFLLILLFLVVALEMVLLSKEYPHFLPLAIHPNLKKMRTRGIKEDIPYRYKSPNKVKNYYGHLGS